MNNQWDARRRTHLISIGLALFSLVLLSIVFLATRCTHTLKPQNAVIKSTSTIFYQGVFKGGRAEIKEQDVRGFVTFTVALKLPRTSTLPAQEFSGYIANEGQWSHLKVCTEQRLGEQSCNEAQFDFNDGMWMSPVLTIDDIVQVGNTLFDVLAEIKKPENRRSIVGTSFGLWA